MRTISLYTAVVAMVLCAGAADAAPLTLKIDYSGMAPTAENEISSLTFENGSGSFEHHISNISPQLFQMVALGTLVPDLTVSAYDGATPLGTFNFENVLFTSVAPQINLTEQVSFAFPASAGFYRVDYPGIAPNAENAISSLALTSDEVTFEHRISNISAQLLSLTASGTNLSNVTFTQDAGPFFGNLTLSDAIFTSVTHPGFLLEDASLAFAGLEINTPASTPVPEPSSILLLCGGLAALLGARRRTDGNSRGRDR